MTWCVLGLSQSPPSGSTIPTRASLKGQASARAIHVRRASMQAKVGVDSEQEAKGYGSMGLIQSVMRKQLHLISFVFCPVKLVWGALVSVIGYITQPWRNLFWVLFNIYLTFWGGVGSLSMTMLVLPIRIYDAMRKGDKMEMEMQDIQKLYKVSEKRVKELERELGQALDKRNKYKDLFDHAEIQKKLIWEKHQQLQFRVLELEDENDFLKAHKERVSKGVHEGERELGQHQEVGSSLLSDGYKVAVKHNHLSDKYSKDLTGEIAALNVGRSLVIERPKHEARGEAMSSSIFSVFLSLLVGAIAWQAEDPCFPLVVAVFMVVCISLKDVALFLVAVCDGGGFDAMALLSFNWFILGTLAHPVLPKIAHLAAPIGTKFGQWVLRLMGINYILEKLRSLFF